MSSIRSLLNINPLKPFNFIVLFSILRVLSNNMVITAPRPFAAVDASRLAPNNPLAPEINFISSEHLKTMEDPDAVIAQTQKKHATEFSFEELSTLFNAIFIKQKFSEIYFVLSDLKHPAKELHAFNGAIQRLQDRSLPKQDPYTVLLYAHFIEEVHPSTNVSALAKETLVQAMYRQYPDLDKARLDHHVLNKNFSFAEKHLSDNLSPYYLKTFRRLALQVSTTEDLLSLSTTELLMHAQIKPLPLPLAHPILRTGLPESGAEEAFYDIYTSFLSDDHFEKMQNETRALIQPEKLTHAMTKQDVELLKLAQRKTSNNPLLRRKFSIVTEKLAQYFYIKSNGEKSIHQQLIAYASDITPNKELFYINLLNTLSKLEVRLEGYDASLLAIRLCLANKELFPADYASREIVTYQKRLLERRDNGTPLFLIYGKSEEAVIRDLCPPDIAEEIIKKEKSLSMHLEISPPMNEPTEWIVEYFPHLALLVVVLGLTHGRIDVLALRKQQKEEQKAKRQAWQEKRIEAAKPSAAPLSKPPTLSNVILETIHELGFLDQSPQDCPTMSDVMKGAPLPVKKIYAVRNADAMPETIELRHPKVFIERLCTLYKTEKTSFEEACQFQDIRRDRAIDTIKTKCGYLVSKHLSLEFNTLMAKNQKAISTPTPTDPTVAAKETINRLLSNKKFPTGELFAWVKLPTTTYTDLLDTVSGHHNDPNIKIALHQLELINDSLVKNKLQLDQHKANYHALVKTYDNTLNPNLDDLMEFSEKIAGIQMTCDPFLNAIATESKQFNALVASINKRHEQLTPKKEGPQESEEEHAARMQRVQDKKKRARERHEARQAEKIKSLEAANKDEIKPAAPVDDEISVKNVLFRRWKKPDDLKTRTALLYANTALFILNDLANAKEQDNEYLRDACILGCTQLYEALRDLSETVFGELLPKTDLLAHYRNQFAHMAMFAYFNPDEWKAIARDTYHHFFMFINTYHQTRAVGGNPIRIETMPALRVPEPGNTDDKQKFKERCERYLAFKEKLRAAYNDEKIMYQAGAINLLLIAMRSLVMQIKDMGEQIGIPTKNKHIARLIDTRNQEAHNGERTSAAELLKLSKPIKALMNMIKTPDEAAKPSEVGVFRRKKKHPTPAPMPLPPKRPN